MRGFLLVGLTALGIASGCTWVKLTPEGAKVKQASAADVASCTRVGTANAMTKDRVLIKRGPQKVQEELVVLAANEAASMGGNAIVPEGVPVEGRQAFVVYKCP
jgi:hypothetical protein